MIKVPKSEVLFMTDRIARGVKDVHRTDLFPTPVDIPYDPFDMGLPDVKITSKRLCEYINAQT
ncbi:MAG: hypothetical protein MJ078_06140, partial [Clostridia bacterium]|nr:hypothetical protein [Clostridia bacterium]